MTELEKIISGYDCVIELVSQLYVTNDSCVWVAVEKHKMKVKES